MYESTLTADQIDVYEQDGYLILRNLFSNEEVALLGATARQDQELDKHQVARADGEGGESRLAVWNHPGNGVYGMFARSDVMVGMVEQLLGQEPYHYHSKMIMKEPHVGGAFAWHQDYGYWYHHGVLKPNMCSVMIAVDKATQENGCLQVIRGSHQMGRIDHGKSGDQVGADMERVDAALGVMELVHCEIDPGDAIVFHGNTLHRSDANKSDKPRWCMISCYNSRDNSPYKESQHPGYTPLEVVPRSAILGAGLNGGGGTSWLNTKRAPTSAAIGES